jgi:hypothetical protein
MMEILYAVPYIFLAPLIKSLHWHIRVFHRKQTKVSLHVFHVFFCCVRVSSVSYLPYGSPEISYKEWYNSSVYLSALSKEIRASILSILALHHTPVSESS